MAKDTERFLGKKEIDRYANSTNEQVIAVIISRSSNIQKNGKDAEHLGNGNYQQFVGEKYEDHNITRIQDELTAYGIKGADVKKEDGYLHVKVDLAIDRETIITAAKQQQEQSEEFIRRKSQFRLPERPGRYNPQGGVPQEGLVKDPKTGAMVPGPDFEKLNSQTTAKPKPTPEQTRARVETAMKARENGKGPGA